MKLNYLILFLVIINFIFCNKVEITEPKNNLKFNAVFSNYLDDETEKLEGIIYENLYIFWSEESLDILNAYNLDNQTLAWQVKIENFNASLFYNFQISENHLCISGFYKGFTIVDLNNGTIISNHKPIMNPIDVRPTFYKNNLYYTKSNYGFYGAIRKYDIFSGESEIIYNIENNPTKNSISNSTIYFNENDGNTYLYFNIYLNFQDTLHLNKFYCVNLTDNSINWIKEFNNGFDINEYQKPILHNDDVIFIHKNKLESIRIM